jgi:hypothetical protein
MKFLSLSLVSLLSIAVVGCVGDPELQGDEVEPADVADTAEVEQRVSAFGIWGYGCTSGFCNYDLGTLTDRTCFLGGLSGDLRGGYALVTRLNGRFRLELRGGTGKTVGATAICISGNTNLVTASWSAGLAAKEIKGVVTSQRRCFLSGVFNGYSTHGFDNTGDYAYVWKDSVGKWWLGGNIAGNPDTSAYATCVDIPSGQGVWGIVAPTVGTASFNMAYNSGNIACGITKIGGPLTGAGAEGVTVNYNAGTRYWTFTASNSKMGEAICYQ